MIDQFLIDHARANVWCAPFQDKQSILSLSRLTKTNGDFQSTRVAWDQIALPDNRYYYHVYQVGANSANRLAWPVNKNQWVQLRWWGEENRQIIDLHLPNGKHIPLTTSYIMRTMEDNYIIAIRYMKDRWDIEKYPPLMRCYRNAYFSDKTSEYKVAMGGCQILSLEEKTKVVNEILDFKKLPGVVNIFHNGDLVPSIGINDIKDRDYVEYTYDGSITRIVDFKVSNLPDFNSELDKVRKYLLHPQKNNDHTIRYRDDVDIYLYRRIDNNKFIGRYYHRYSEKSMRMVTHFDYSIPTNYVQAYLADADDKWAEYKDLYIRLHIRDSGLDRPLVYETNRIHELYRLKDNEILDAMLGLNAVMNEWKVNTLESSMYTWIMRQWDPFFTLDNVLDAYGYNAVSKLIADTPQQVVTNANGNYVDLPIGLQKESTVFEYDEKGLLLGYYPHGAGSRYYTRNPNANIIEGLVGIGTFDEYWVEGNTARKLDLEYSYHFYFCETVRDIPTKNWKPAVEGVNYTFVAGQLTWIHDKYSFYGLILSDKTFLCHEFEDEQDTNIHRFSIIHRQLGLVRDIQPERIDLFINGHYAVPELHYRLIWPEIVVVNAEFLKPGKNKFMYRCIGLPEDMVNLVYPGDRGFVEHGILSLDHRYQTRHDKVMTTFLEGGMMLPSRVAYAEDWDNSNGPHVNGDIYQISPLPVPIRGISNERYWELRRQAEDTDRRLEDYLTLRYPEPKFTTPSPIVTYHYLFSPMLMHITRDIIKGYLIPPFEPEEYTAVNEAVADYLFYLPYEPARNDVNTNYVRLIPHPGKEMIKVGERTFRFLESINRFYLGGKVDISGFYQVEGLV